MVGSMSRERLLDLVAHNPGRTARELLAILRREDLSGLTKSQLNSALYRHPDLRVEKITEYKRVWHVKDSPPRSGTSARINERVRTVRTKELSLYPWQREALEWWQDQGCKGIVEAVTGSGKTRVALAATAAQLRRGGRVVVVVPTKDLLNQWRKEIEKRLKGELGMEFSLGLFEGGRDDRFRRPDVLIATVQSGCQNHLLLYSGDGLLVADEVHHYGAERWSLVLEPEFDRRLGLTATYEREDAGVERYLDPYFGGSVFRVDYERALADDVIAPFKIAFVAVEFSREERRLYDENNEKASKRRKKLIDWYGLPEEPFGEFMREVNHLAIGGEGEATGLARGYLSAFSKRRQALAGAREKFSRLADLSAAVRTADKSILFAQTQEAAANAVKRLNGRGVNGAVLTSSMDMSERKEVFAAFENRDTELVAAPRLLDEGVDVPAADLASCSPAAGPGARWCRGWAVWCAKRRMGASHAWPCST